MLATGDSGAVRGPRGSTGFSLLELMVALAIAGLILALAVPASTTLYDNIRYRQAVRDAVTLFASARHLALDTGRRQDVVVDPEARTLTLDGRTHALPAGVGLTVHAARELSGGREGVIRFYPEGGASGGGIDIETRGGGGVKVVVDWLTGGVEQERYAASQ
ncbi:MAG: general secretion pathway protein GspH [Haliea sp.]|nr:general secretion pathway protein GspH [Haliea sp.]